MTQPIRVSVSMRRLYSTGINIIVYPSQLMGPANSDANIPTSEMYRGSCLSAIIQPVTITNMRTVIATPQPGRPARENMARKEELLGSSNPLNRRQAVIH